MLFERGDKMFRKLTYVLYLMLLFTLLIACSNGEAKEIEDVNYDDLINDARELYESEMDRDYPDREYIYGDDFESYTDVDIYKNGKFLKFVMYNAGYDYHGDTHTIYFENTKNGIEYLGKSSKYDSDDIDNMVSDYSKRKEK